LITLVEMLEQNYRICPEKSAIICDGRACSYSEFYRKVASLSQYFFRSGIKKGDKIAIMMRGKKTELAIAFMGVAACGGIVVPVDCNQTDSYILKLFNLISPAAVVVSEQMLSRFEICRLNLPESRIIVCQSSSVAQAKSKSSFTQLIDILACHSSTLPSLNIGMNDIVYFNMTSGTTGFPKCAITTHANIYWNTLSSVEQLSLTSEDVHLCMFPPATHPHEIFARPLFLGGTMILSDYVAPKSLTKIIEDYRVTAMMAVSPIYGNLTKCHRKSKFNFTSLKLAESGGMHVDPITAMEFKEKFNIPIIPVWGSTETAGIVLAMPLNAKSKIGSCGIPSKYYEVDIIDENGNKTLPGEEGEMIVRGKGVCHAYYQNKIENQKNFKNGWYHTNDMFRKDIDGFFYFSGRKNGMMKIAGLKVFPVEIEDTLIQHPQIKEVCVIKANDPLHGEIPKAVIVLETGALLTPKAIREYCMSKIALYKIPKIIEFRNSIPKNSVGKILINKIEIS